MIDMFSTGDFGPHPPDVELGGKDDILLFGGRRKVDIPLLRLNEHLLPVINTIFPLLRA